MLDIDLGLGLNADKRVAYIILLVSTALVVFGGVVGATLCELVG